MENRANTTPYGNWFQTPAIPHYSPPRTMHYSHMLGPSVLIEKDNYVVQKAKLKSSQPKSKRISPFHPKSKGKVPGPGHY